jgi:uncharacterized protein GlcG (DUF336 family)
MSIAINTSNIAYQTALAVCKASISKAEILKINISVSVCDTSGLELAFLRMNDSYIHSIDIAKNKAYTSASFKFPSGTWTDIFKKVPHLEQGFSNRDKLIPFGGGLPIMLNDKIIGAIGVSGGSEEEDIICAKAGIDSIIIKEK